MTTDSRTNEPTEVQVEAAAKALRADEGFMAGVHSALEVSWSEYIARLVLVAAQEAEPQAESEPKPHTHVVTRSFDSDCALGICMRECSHLMWVCDSCSSEGGWGASRDKLKKWAGEHVCPVLPSSNVPESPGIENLNEVIAAVIETHKDAIGAHYPECWKYHAGCLAVLLRDLGVVAPPKSEGENDE